MCNTRTVDKDKIDYAVGISTRGRTDILVKTIEAFKNQTLPPSLVLVIDNNDEYGTLNRFIKPLYSKNTKVMTIENHYALLNDACGSQTALEFMNYLGYKIGVKWDDDLVPEKDCLKPLVEKIYNGGLAAGGMYPRVNIKGITTIFKNKLLTEDGKPLHVQFFSWDKKKQNRWLFASHLYSSFAYNIEKANLIGGFCTEYSQLAYRHETDFTLRLNELNSDIGFKNLGVYTGSEAIHYMGTGGTRMIPFKKAKKMMRLDTILFTKRMRNMDMELSYES